ncbi:MAG: S9 family peptidase, partial [Opitutae bacterium]|nr:S9 family peptidase [Opitutae bacterium]
PFDSLGVLAYDLGKDFFVQVLTNPENPSELYTSVNRKMGYNALTNHNSSWLAGKKLSAVEPHSFTNKEGLTIQYWTMKPTEFDPAKKYPLLLQVHGGPAAMWGPGEDSMWFEFQYFAARGYAIVFCNPRGSGGYGFDFQHANYQDWGTGPASDILTSVDFAAKENYIDKNREVVTGGSYGGYMVAWLVGHDHRFKAAVAQRGVYHLPTFFGEANAWRLVPSHFGGYPWEETIRPILERESPFNYVDQITTPLLIQHGDHDRRTGFVQSEMMLKALKVLGRDVEEVRYPRATHEMSRSGEPKQRLDSLVRYEEFFRRYIGEN